MSIANPSFGFQVSTDGSGFTWAVNSQQNQITPWSNDPVGDAPGEVIYVRDEETGEVWGPTALPIREKIASYSVRHGQGYSRFEHTSHGIALELAAIRAGRRSDQDLAAEDRQSLRARARGCRSPPMSNGCWAQSRVATAPFIVTEVDSANRRDLRAESRGTSSFGERVAFADLGGRQTAWTGDRTEFLGRDGTLDRPLALTPGAALSNRVGAGLDPCARVADACAAERRSARRKSCSSSGRRANGAEAQALHREIP